MTQFSRRHMLALSGASFLTACGNGIGSPGSAKIDARVDEAFNFMYANVDGSADLAAKAAGILMMPLVSEAGLITLGGSYGRGALRINDATVDYYSVAGASFGLQLGVQQYAHALFFMTQEALNDFRRSPGWVAGADARVTVQTDAGQLGVDTTTALTPVVALVFGQAGLIAGASVEGNKYTRIIP